MALHQEGLCFCVVESTFLGLEFMEQLAYFRRRPCLEGLGTYLLEGLVPIYSSLAAHDRALVSVVHNLVDALPGNLAMFQNVHPNIVMFHLLMT